jgi:hypothetical protein
MDLGHVMARADDPAQQRTGHNGGDAHPRYVLNDDDVNAQSMSRRIEEELCTGASCVSEDGVEP